MRNGAGYFVYLPESVFPTEQEMDEKWTDGFTCALQLLVISNDHQTAKMLIDESNIDVQEFIDAQERSMSFPEQMQAFFDEYYPAGLEFTEMEWEIIKHRLEVPDALADALESEHTRDSVYLSTANLNGSDGVIDWCLDECEKAVLQDAIEGSTFFAAMSWADSLGEKGDAEKLRKKYEASAKSIEEKTGFNLPRG